MTSSTASDPSLADPQPTPCPPGGVNLAALASRLATTWCRRWGSPIDERWRQVLVEGTPAARKREASESAASAATRPTVQGAALELQAGGLGRGQGLQVLHHPPQPHCFVVQRASAAGEATVTPSTSASVSACRMAMGVRSSWATSATRARRRWSSRSSDAAMASNARPSSPSSPGPARAPTRTALAPCSSDRAAADRRRIGRTTPRATATPTSRAPRAASAALQPTAPASADRRWLSLVLKSAGREGDPHASPPASTRRARSPGPRRSVPSALNRSAGTDR